MSDMMDRRRAAPRDRRDPWERQPGEGERPFVAFAAYRDQEPGSRSIRQVARELGKSGTLIGRWSVRWRWGARVEAWDGEQDRRRRTEMVALARDAHRRRLAAGKKLQAVALDRLDRLPSTGVSASQIARLLEVGVAIEQEALGCVSDAPSGVGARDGLDGDVQPYNLTELLRRNPTKTGPFVTLLAEMLDATGAPPGARGPSKAEPAE